MRLCECADSPVALYKGAMVVCVGLLAYSASIESHHILMCSFDSLCSDDAKFTRIVSLVSLLCDQSKYEFSRPYPP